MGRGTVRRRADGQRVRVSREPGGAHWPFRVTCEADPHGVTAADDGFSCSTHWLFLVLGPILLVGDGISEPEPVADAQCPAASPAAAESQLFREEAP